MGLDKGIFHGTTYIYAIKYWLVVSNMNFIFHFIYVMSFFPLTFTPSFFKMFIAPPTRYCYKYIYKIICYNPIIITIYNHYYWYYNHYYYGYWIFHKYHA